MSSLMASRRAHVMIEVLLLVLATFMTHTSALLENPDFSEPIANVTAAVGREAILACVVDGLVTYKVAWLRVDTQTILTIHNHVITKNRRIGVTHSEGRTWYLHIKEVRESDRGWYMCQINTDPMKSQNGYMDVVVPPDILDYQSSADMVVNEGSNVSLRCIAKGSPQPSITWRRENGLPIFIQADTKVLQVDGEVLNITGVTREQMGAYLCIASNGIPPSVSKRIMLTVHFPPKLWIQYQLIGAYDDQRITLQCHSEAFPKSINYWTRSRGEIIAQNEHYNPEIVENGYGVHMNLTLLKIRSGDYGLYKCVSKNAVGETEGTINVYRLPKPAANKKFYGRNNKISKDQISFETYQVDTSLGQDVNSKEDLTSSSFRHYQARKFTLLFCFHLLFMLFNV